jgi:hypothetical protein
MSRTPQQILETVASARAVAEQLRTRLSVERNVMDLGDLVHIQSTIKHIEEHLRMAAEDEEILRDRLKRTAARVPELGLSVASGAPRRELGRLKGRIEIAADFDAPLPDELLNDLEGHGAGK